MKLKSPTHSFFSKSKCFRGTHGLMFFFFPLGFLRRGSCYVLQAGLRFVAVLPPWPVQGWDCKSGLTNLLHTVKKQSGEGQRVECLGFSITRGLSDGAEERKELKKPCKSAPWVISRSLNCEAQGEAKSANAWGAQAETPHRHTLTMVTLGLRRWHQNFTEDHIQHLCFRCDLP